MGSKGSHHSQPVPPPPPAPPPPIVGWEFQYCKNMIAGQTPESFDFPVGVDGVHMCVKAGSPMTLAQTVSIQFTIAFNGPATFVANDGGSPCGLRLYMQEVGDNFTGLGVYQFYRFWSQQRAELTGPNTYLLSAKLDPTLWIPVGGNQYVPGPNYEYDKADGFAKCVANAQFVGFSFGGWSAAHGIYVKGGTAHFTLNSFTVA